MASSKVQVKGLRELLRDFGRMDRALRSEMVRELKVVGQVVADQARQNYEGLYQRRSGKAETSFRVGVARGRVVVRNSAKNRGFNYPSRQEYGSRGKAFLVPALEQRRGDVEAAFGDMLDRITSTGGFGRGGRL